MSDSDNSKWYNHVFDVITHMCSAIGKTVFASRNIFLLDWTNFTKEIADIFDATQIQFIGYKIVGVIVGFIISIILLWEIIKKIIRTIIKYYKKKTENTEL